MSRVILLGALITILCLILVQAQLRVTQVQVLIRHGDRTPRLQELYPNDIHNVSEYEPWGLAQLTNTGKMRAYQIGRVLKTRYQDLLGTLHLASGVYAVSTDSDRAKMSLQLLLAGLFPPSEAQMWNPELPWIPIPIHYVPQQLDILMKSFLCPELKEVNAQVRQLPEVQAKIAAHNDFLNFLTVKTGVNLTEPEGASRIHDLLVSQKSMNLSLPEWCTDTIFRQLGEIQNLKYEIFSYTTKIRRLHGGPMVRKFIENMYLDRAQENPRKIYLYSTHDINVSAVLRAHGIIVPEIPYGTAVILEKLQDANGNRFIKMLLWNGVTEQLNTLRIPGCEDVCPIGRYLKITREVIPSDEEMDCHWRRLTARQLRSLFNERMNYN